MANHVAVGVSSCGSSQANTNPHDGLQFSPQHDDIHTQYCQNQQGGLFSYTGSSTANHASFDSLMDMQLSPLYGWESQNLFDDLFPTILDSFIEEISEESSWLYKNTNVKTCAGLI